ncbi:MAG: filamentous hemagglutinin N-terminal domain-containing protein [Hormoscilla sp.]
MKSSNLTILGLSSTMLLLLATASQGQIVPDSTLPNNTVVTPSGNNFTIDGGTTAGANLFHSFQEFSVPTNGGALFNNAPAIENIITRVTGGKISNIDGLIRGNGTANLFMINPSGIMFGPNARLDIGGSFLGTTAESLLFADGNFYSATEPNAPPLLTINVPLGLQYGPRSGSLRVEGSDRPRGLSVRPGQTLSLVGGDVIGKGGAIGAPDGRIELGSVRQGEVSLRSLPSGWRLDYSPNSEFGNINISEAQLFAPTSHENPDSGIQVVGENILLENNSQIATEVRGKFPGGDVDISASQLTLVQGGRIETFVEENAGGNGGNVTVKAREAIVAIGVNRDNPRQISRIGTESRGAGASGEITISTGELILRDGGGIQSIVRGTGKGGDINIEATESILATGVNPAFPDSGDGIMASTFSAADGGSINITTEQLRLERGSRIQTTVSFPGIIRNSDDDITEATGNAGNLIVNVGDLVEISGPNPLSMSTSGLYSSTRGAGDAGDAIVNTRSLRVLDGGVVSSNSNISVNAQFSELRLATGNGGNSTINASESIEVRGFEPTVFGSSFISTFTVTEGNAGNLIINTPRLLVVDGAQVNSTTSSSGNAGEVTINAREIAVSGIEGPTGEPSEISASAFQLGEAIRETFMLPPVTTGDTGKLTINTSRLLITDGGIVTVEHDGTGDAGNLFINANKIRLLRGGSIGATTATGQGGDVFLNVEDSLQLGSDSAIAVSATGGLGDGGNLTIDAATLVLRSNSRISANAEQGNGGNISIQTQGLFSSTDSEITASSELGLSGNIFISNPEVDTSSAIVELKSEVQDPSQQIITSCAAGENTLVVTGRGGLAENPTDTIRGSTLWRDREDYTDVPPTSQRQHSPEEIIRTTGHPLVEATGWIRHPDGTIELVAELPHQQTLNRANCQ